MKVSLFLIHFILSSFGVSGTRLCSSDIQGEKGEKGNSGTCAQESPIQINNVLRGYLELEDGWISPFNGYQYKAYIEKQTFNDSRSICQSWGGDLIQFGFRECNTKIIITHALSLADGINWIGLTDQATEGKWRWLNGHQSSTDDVNLWLPDRPSSNDSSSTYNCAQAWFSFSREDAFLAKDVPCTWAYRFVCEKTL